MTLAPRRLIVTADDFGRDIAVNEAVERAHRDGILSTTSLMVGAPAAADAVARARRQADLHVGLHLVLIDGDPVLPREELGCLVRCDGRFDDNPLRSGLRFCFRPKACRLLAAEIRAQFEAFRATGLALDHVNAHKHMHLHPTVARLVIEIGRDYGMHAVRLPAESKKTLRRAFPGERLSSTPPAVAVAALRRRLRRSGLAFNDHVFGIAWSGGMTEERVLELLPHLPRGVSEIYSHPATDASAAVPGYRPLEELAALVSPRVQQLIDELGITLVTYADVARKS
ncbi:MAG: hopanoid biosynthesis-associated protein HpnK [Alphaproteobacteria bacterium]|nr:hopanoid biosynthesis-associated protein HpnK [Alphaproteobacteria bacterium]